MTAPSVAIYTRLVATGFFGTRVYPRKLPPDVPLPAAVYQMVSSPEQESLYHGGANSLRQQRWQVDIYETTYTAAETLAIALYPFLHGVSGWWGGVDVQLCYVDLEREADDSATGTHRRQLDLQLQFQQT